MLRDRGRGHRHADSRPFPQDLQAAAEYAATRGIIIADTKFEFGVIDGKVTLIDECLTPDSSRFWPAASYEEGKIQPSYDKQFVRNWLKANWDMTGETPHLPAEVIDGTSERYREPSRSSRLPVHKHEGERISEYP